MMYLGDKIYQLAFQEALRDPAKWALEVQAKADTVKSMLFPGDGVNQLNETDIKNLLKEFDENKDGLITNSEIWNTFQYYKVEMNKPFVKKIAAALQKLNYETLQPVTFTDATSVYYYSGPDHTLTYNMSLSFCG